MNQIELHHYIIILMDVQDQISDFHLKQNPFFFRLGNFLFNIYVPKTACPTKSVKNNEYETNAIQQKKFVKQSHLNEAGI